MTARASLLAFVASTLGLAACRSDWRVLPPVGPLPPGFPVDVGDGREGDLFLAAGARVVNACVPVVDVAGEGISVADESPFEAGRRILLLQAQAELGVSPGPTEDVADPGIAGAWEVARVTSLGPAALVLEDPPSLSYASSGGFRAQACTLPEFDTVRVGAGAAVVAAPWDGGAGGVLAFLARTVVLEGAARLSADGAGFRGGTVSSDGAWSGITDYEPSQPGMAAGKGEGIDGTAFGRIGRGAMANAGGGGNAYAAGGGGGGSAGRGGLGGSEIGGSQNPDTAGLGGGKVIDVPDVRLLFGGGGGGGHDAIGYDDGAGPGGAGGGVVLVVAEALEGTGALTADGIRGGDAQVPFNGAGGAGGGGAGGTVAVWAVSAPFGIAGFARGGAGGNAPPGNPWAPGGGGGGGRVYRPASLVVEAGPGSAGDSSDPHGATPGAGGEDVPLPAP